MAAAIQPVRRAVVEVEVLRPLIGEFDTAADLERLKDRIGGPGPGIFAMDRGGRRNQQAKCANLMAPSAQSPTDPDARNSRIFHFNHNASGQFAIAPSSPGAIRRGDPVRPPFTSY